MSLYDVWWSAWIGIMTRPRRTIRKIIDERPDYQLPLLTLLTGFTTQANSAIALHGLYAWQTWFKTLVVGPISGFATIYIGAIVLNWCGERVGGNGTVRSLRAAIAWGGVPGIVLMPIMAILGIMTTLTNEALLRPNLDMNQIQAYIVIGIIGLLSILLLAGLVWMLIIMYRCYSEALELGCLWTFVAAFMSMIILVIPLYLFSRIMLLI